MCIRDRMIIGMWLNVMDIPKNGSVNPIGDMVKSHIIAVSIAHTVSLRTCAWEEVFLVVFICFPPFKFIKDT